jgi:hypothetical protein
VRGSRTNIPAPPPPSTPARSHARSARGDNGSDLRMTRCPMSEHRNIAGTPTPIAHHCPAVVGAWCQVPPRTDRAPRRPICDRATSPRACRTRWTLGANSHPAQIRSTANPGPPACRALRGIRVRQHETARVHVRRSPATGRVRLSWLPCARAVDSVVALCHKWTAALTPHDPASCNTVR